MVPPFEYWNLKRSVGIKSGVHKLHCDLTMTCDLFFFVVLFITFHMVNYSNSTHVTYSCIGTIGKNCQNPHERVLVKNHCREKLIVFSKNENSLLEENLKY